ncbi:MAG: hypothetical protein HOO67_01460 [Candidatus Peribacteraceae bacterium]|nr:hypothetical protein [Candidatus Peribacteraceae bacterium]
MQLVRFLSGHFASLHSPTRERREVGFAITDPNDPGNKEKGLEALGGSGSFEGIDLTDTQYKLALTTPETMIEGFSETCESVDLFQEVLRWSMVGHGDVATLIREELKREGLNVGTDTDLSLISGSDVSIERRLSLMKEIFTKHPEITLLCAKRVSKSIEFHDELVGQIDRRLAGVLSKKFPILQKHEIFAHAQAPALQSLAESLAGIPNGQLSPLLVDMQSGESTLDSRTIAVRIGALREDQNESELLENDKMVVRFLIECNRAWKRAWHIDSGHWYDIDPTPVGDDEYKHRQQKYLTSLEKQKKALSTFLEAAISDRVQTIVQENVEKGRSILAAIGDPDGKLSPEEKHFRLLMRPDATGKKIAGYGLVAFEDALHKHVDPLKELGIGQPGHKATDEGFLEYAATALPIIQERMRGGERDLERLLAQKRADQENVERWAFDTAQRLRRLSQLDDARRGPIEKIVKKHLGETLTDLHDRFEPYADLANLESRLQEQKQECIAATDPEFDPNFRDDLLPETKGKRTQMQSRNKRQRITSVLDQCENNPGIFAQAEAAGRDVDAETQRMESINDVEILRVVQQTRQQLDTVLGDIRQSPYFQHEVCNTLDVADKVDQKNSYIRDTLLAVTEKAGSLAPETPVSVVLQPADSMVPGIIFTKDLPSTTPVSTPTGIVEAGSLPRKTPVSVTAQAAGTVVPGTVKAGFLHADTPVSTPNSIATLRKNLPQAQRGVSDLQEILERLRFIKIEEKDLGKNKLGHFKDGISHINNNAEMSEVEKQTAVFHESGHAALWALETAFPLLLSEHVNILRDQAPLLRTLQDFHHYRGIAAQQDEWSAIARVRLKKLYDDEMISDQMLQQETDNVFMEKMFNELLVRHAEWVRDERRTESKDPREQALFRKLDERKTTQLPAMNLARRLSADAEVSTGTLARLRDEEEEAETVVPRNPAGPEGPEAVKEEFNIPIELREVQRNIEMIEYFIKAYKEEHPNIEPELRPYLDHDKDELEKLNKRFLKAQGNDQSPEEDEELIARIREVRKNTDTIVEAIKDIDKEQLDISKVTPTKPAGFFEGMAFMSLSDVAKLWTDLGEDLKSIYKRRQDRVLKEAGAGITSLLGTMGSKIPYYGEYFAGLRGYHDRRYSGTDVEAANKWQESMKFIDSHTVLDMLETTGDKDLLRGGIGLLVERGEMDWNDVRVWKTFMRMTGYNMPIGACLRNDVLRDTWLRKMVNSLWDDKEQYYHWRQGNDSHYESHKKEFTPMVDQFANVGGMKVELKKQLKLWVEWQATHHSQPLPDDVKPHLYEEVLHYAMRNGKMHMEDKFFYLVQGVRHGLLSIDRLRVLAGEGGEILLRFPFIDYFYQKNNSHDEVKRLGERLEEASDNRYDPGAKTMYFLQYEVPKEQGFKERLSKALGRDNIEKIDHEDWPMIVACIDYGKTDEMTGVLSGSRYKITKESAKNSYVGFNTKFTAFGRLADLDTANKARFTKGDAQSIATTVTAFLHFDNLLTRNGWDKLNRLTLTKNDINNSAGPYMADGTTVKVYRDGAYEFIHRLMQELENADLFDWTKVSEKPGIKEKYIQKVGEMNDERLSLVEPDGHQKQVYEATAKFSSQLEEALKSPKGMKILKEILSLHSDRKRITKNYLLEESATKEKPYLTKEKAEEYVDDLAKSKNAA